MLDEKKIIKGGCGRTAKEIEASAAIFAFSLIAACLILTLVILLGKADRHKKSPAQPGLTQKIKNV